MGATAHLIRYIGEDIQFKATQFTDGVPHEIRLTGVCIGIDPRPQGKPDGEYLIIRVGSHPSTVLHTVPLRDCRK